MSIFYSNCENLLKKVTIMHNAYFFSRREKPFCCHNLMELFLVQRGLYAMLQRLTDVYLVDVRVYDKEGGHHNREA